MFVGLMMQTVFSWSEFFFMIKGMSGEIAMIHIPSIWNIATKEAAFAPIVLLKGRGEVIAKSDTQLATSVNQKALRFA